jgi:aspartate racemase
MQKRIIGILGGMGPQATVDLYREILTLTPARRDQDHVPVLIYSNPKIPDRTSAILEGAEDPMPQLVEAARVLESAGAGRLAIPCNTAHYFLPALAREVAVPFFDMIAETLSELRRELPGIRTVGLLAATGTVRTGIYHRTFAAEGVTVLAPGDAAQRRVHDGIFQVKAATHDRQTGELFESIGAELVAAGAETVILGCTEIPLAFDPKRAGYPSINATRVLAAAAVDWALGKRP